MHCHGMSILVPHTRAPIFLTQGRLTIIKPYRAEIAHLLAVLAVPRLPGMQHHVVGMLTSAASCLHCSPVLLMNADAAPTAASFGTEATSLHC